LAGAGASADAGGVVGAAGVKAAAGLSVFGVVAGADEVAGAGAEESADGADGLPALSESAFSESVAAAGALTTGGVFALSGAATLESPPDGGVACASAPLADSSSATAVDARS
jgi:hypothetical protein